MSRKLLSSPRRLLLISLTGLVVLILVGGALFIVSQNGTKAQSGEMLAPAITLPTFDHQNITLPAQSNQVTVLFTMGYWCSDCIAGAKTLAQLQGAYADRGVRFVAVDVTPNVTADDLPVFIDQIGSNQMEWAMDASGHFANLYAVNALDTAIVLDRQGYEVYRNHQGESDADIRATLDKLLAS
ncbi:MAG TPA: TlpA disulfide reductase family protein [Aggregatilineales bacterium]|nr:TlpA disulfide reductase family protein [Aggregatilineales bacterium]